MRQPAYFNVQFFRDAADGVAQVAASCQLSTHPAGTPGSDLATYTSEDGGTPNTNPIILDADGRCSLYLDPAEEYLLRLFEPVADGGAHIRDFDDVVAAPASTEVVTSVNGEVGAVTLTPAMIDYTSPTLDWFDAENVQDALDQLATRLDAPPAESVVVTDAADHFTGTNAEDVFAELGARMVPDPTDHKGEGLRVNPDTGVVEWSADTGAPSGTIGAAGSVTFPGGLIMKWGVTGSLSAGANAIAFPAAFPTACYSVVVTPMGDGGSDHVEDGHSFSASSFATTGFSIGLYTDPTAFSWFAVGK